MSHKELLSTAVPPLLISLLQRGLAGDSASGGESRANFPVFFAEEYDPWAPEVGRGLHSRVAEPPH